MEKTYESTSLARRNPVVYALIGRHVVGPSAFFPRAALAGENKNALERYANQTDRHL